MIYLVSKMGVLLILALIMGFFLGWYFRNIQLRKYDDADQRAESRRFSTLGEEDTLGDEELFDSNNTDLQFINSVDEKIKASGALDSQIHQSIFNDSIDEIVEYHRPENDAKLVDIGNYINDEKPVSSTNRIRS